MASGINSTFRQVGIATGIAALGAIFQSTVASHVAAALTGTPLAGDGQALGERVAGGDVRGALASVPGSARDGLDLAIRTGFVDGLNELLIVASLVAAVGGTLALLLVRTAQEPSEERMLTPRHTGPAAPAGPAPGRSA